MNSSGVVHHVDYRSKAEDRRRELEKLQKRGLAKTKASQLKNAPAPTEACNFLRKQRELFAARRKNQAEAIEFLHQYRAEEEPVLRTPAARHSLGSNTYKYSARHNVTSRLSLSPVTQRSKLEPDARAPVYSYAVYPIQIPNANDNANHHNPIARVSSTPVHIEHLPEIDTKAMSFESAYSALELVAKEASMLPLPKDGVGKDFVTSVFNTCTSVAEEASAPTLNNDEYGNHSIGSTLDVSEKIKPTPPSRDNEDDTKKTKQDIDTKSEPMQQITRDDYNNGRKNEKEINTGGEDIEEVNSGPILILEGEHDNDPNIRPDSQLKMTANEILIVDGDSCSPDDDMNIDPSHGDFIPFEAFSKLGESMVAGSIIGTQDGEHTKEEVTATLKVGSEDDTIIPGKYFMQLGASMMANDLYPSNDKQEIDQEVESAPAMEKSDMMKTIATASTETSLFSDQSKSSMIECPTAEATSNCRRSERNILPDTDSKFSASLGTEDVILGPRTPHVPEVEQEQTMDGGVEMANTNTLEAMTTGVVSVNLEERKNELIDQVSTNANSFAHSLDVAPLSDNKKFDATGTPTKSNSSAGRRDERNPNVETDTPDIATNNNVTAKTESHPAMNKTENTSPEDRSSLARRHRSRRKKKEKSYYPPSSLFVARHFLSR